MKKSIICIVAAITVFVCSVLPVSAGSGDILYKRRIYPGKEISDYTGYKYGNYKLSVTLPAGSFSETSESSTILENAVYDLIIPDATFTGSFSQNDSDIVSPDSPYDEQYTVEHGVGQIVINSPDIEGQIALDVGLEKTTTTSSGSMSYVFQGQLSFVRVYTWMPDYTKLSGCDELQIWTVNYGWNEILSGAKGTVTSISYTIDMYGDKIELLDGYNAFYFSKPGSSMTVNTIVNFSVVVPEVSTENFTFTIDLNSRVDNSVGDRWVLTPYQLYYDASDFLGGFKDIFDSYWSESSDDKVSSSNVDSVVTDFDNIESQISDKAFDFIGEFDFSNSSFESGGEDFLFATTWLSATLMRMFAVSFEFSTIFYFSMGLLLVCILLGIRKFWR